jgi:hypothetical protein
LKLVFLGENLTGSADSKQSSVVNLIRNLARQDRNVQIFLSAELQAIKSQLEAFIAERQAFTTHSIADLVKQLHLDVEHASKVRYILSSFRFDVMRTREHEVKENHAKTFEWMFSDDSYFSRWLRQDSGLFWISGKAGSGKSTLMKFLFESPKTQDMLDAWAGDSKLVISRHFFWNAGTSMQKSYRGLLQSLCYDIFQACPELLPHLCGKLWESLTSADCLESSYRNESKWSEVEMVELIRRAAQFGAQTGSRDMCLFFFIDGLDEYQGGNDQLVEAITTLSKIRNVKVCVSARPWNVFKETFKELSQKQRVLTLQNLTQNDIVSYVKDKLDQNRGFARLQLRDPRCSELFAEITTKAEGVFLWVYLVINELMKSLANDDDFVTLQRRLRRIPPGLSEYFRYMFDKLDGFYASQTSHIFRAVLASTYRMPILALSVIFSTEPLAAQLLSDLGAALSEKDNKHLEATLSTRMAGCCGDLLEVKHGKVQYLHRTVREFLATAEITKELEARSEKDFDIDVTMCRMSLICIQLDLKQLRHLRITNYLVSFYGHTRKLEEKNDQSPRDLREAFRTISSTAKLSVFTHATHLQFLACMNLKLEVDHCMRTMKVSLPMEDVTRCCREALKYLLLSERTVSKTIDSIYIPKVIEWAGEHDADRRGFRLDMITSLLGHGADSTELWNWSLPVMHNEREDCSEYRRGMFFKVSSELIQVGARQIDGEEEMLEDIFGRSNTQWLLSLRQSPLGRLVNTGLEMIGLR